MFGRSPGDRDRLVELGAEVVAISVDTVEVNRRLAKELKLNIPVLSDLDREVVRAYDLLDAKGIASPWPLIAQPATFIIDKKALVRYADVSPAEWHGLDDRPNFGVVFERLKQILRSGTK